MYVVVKNEWVIEPNISTSILFMTESFEQAESVYLDYIEKYVKAHETKKAIVETHNCFSIVRHLYGYCTIGIHAIPVDKEVEVQI